jgi:hypothetical protein
MDDPDFVKNFDDLYLELTILNYKHRSNIKQFSEKELKTITHLKLLMPILKRLRDQGSDLDINTLLDKTTDSPTCGTVPEIVFNPDYFPSAPVLKLPIDTDSDEYTKINLAIEQEPEEETSEDLEGDLQVNKLTDITLELLSNIKKNNWTLVENKNNDVVEDDDNDDEEEDEEEEEIEEYQEEYGEDDKKSDIDTAPQLILV